MDKNDMIVTTNLSKSYDDKTHVLKDLNIVIRKGEWVNIMGPSGSGKTTLLNILSCLDRPTNGSIIINGTEVTKLSQNEMAKFRRENIGLVFQQYHLIPYLTALENVMLAQHFHSMVDEEEAKKALELVGLGHRLEHIPAHLSGGEQQRVSIARALINQPSLILADEPTGNLDRTNGKIILDLFKKLHKNGHTIVIVTHDPEIGMMGDRLIKLMDGRTVDERESA
ncbi:ABC transporter ATP-binding protein [Fonticella tunisiensis]|uniref:Putative ABC transport system ATP-binding protein n=1 Tax=Fonticella tunisiensis TaxID=1096341 RepID=A0A4V3ETM1_9CLOT|nr:ABC transporter ATP-binding protein [Fonticella tunisiensis]TDT57258.1 putative ABC transport system ATP-binding protein [Fonticella tunisiensis]